MKKTDNKELFGATRPGKLFFLAAVPGSISTTHASTFVARFLCDSITPLLFPVVPEVNMMVQS